MRIWIVIFFVAFLQTAAVAEFIPYWWLHGGTPPSSRSPGSAYPPGRTPGTRPTRPTPTRPARPARPFLTPEQAQRIRDAFRNLPPAWTQPGRYSITTPVSAIGVRG